MEGIAEWFFQSEWSVFGQTLTPASISVGVLCALVGLLLSAVFMSNRFRRFLTRTGVDSGFSATVGTILGFLVTIAGIMVGLHLAGLPVSWDIEIPGIGLSILVVLRLLVVLTLVFWVSAFLKRFIFRRYLSRSGLNRSLQFSISQIIGYSVLILGAALAIQNAGIDLSTLAVLAGAIGVGIGFGLQNLAGNFISGVILLLERPVEIGDRVEVAGVTGQVRQIRARSTTVVTNDNISIIIPNTKFVDEPVTNWTHTDPKVRIRVPIGVAYGSDVGRVKEVLLGVARAHPHALSDPEPTVFFEGFGESSLDFELAVWTGEMSYRPRRFRSDLNFAIESGLREAGIEIPFPQRDLHVRTIPDRMQSEG